MLKQLLWRTTLQHKFCICSICEIWITCIYRIVGNSQRLKRTFIVKWEFSISLQGSLKLALIEIQWELGVFWIKVTLVKSRSPNWINFLLQEHIPIDILAPDVLLNLFNASLWTKPLLRISLYQPFYQWNYFFIHMWWKSQFWFQDSLLHFSFIVCIIGWQTSEHFI